MYNVRKVNVRKLRDSLGWTVEWVSQKRSTSHERHQPLFCFIIVLSGSSQPLRSVERKVKPHSRFTVLSNSLSLSLSELSWKKEGSLCTVPHPRHICIEPLFLTFQPINFDSSSNINTIGLKNHENELLKLSRDRAHHRHDARASSWPSRADEERRRRDVGKWTRSDYRYLAEEFSQGERYTEGITQAASTLWAQRT